MPDSKSALLAHHERSKHRLDRYAPGPGRLDWANQPDPFREFRGAPRVQLPLAADAVSARYGDLRRGELPPPREFNLESIGALFELSLGLSAWKSLGGQRWALRCNPSSGNLHPTEGYLVCPALDAIAAGVHHYVSRDHVLERRARVRDGRWNEAFDARGVIVGLSSIHWREAWKYGMRAWRYCQHDCGHAIAALSYAAAALGWQSRVVHAAPDELVARLLGLDRQSDFGSAEAEAPDLLVWIGDASSRVDVTRITTAMSNAVWEGCGNRLSESHVEWRDIETIHALTRRPATREPVESLSALPAPAPPGLNFRYAELARRRRSAVDFDGVTRITFAQFAAMLEGVVKRAGAPPWNAWAPAPCVHLAMMVHRVDGLEPGLYMLLRDARALDAMRRSLRPDWLWRKVGPEHLALFLLLPHDLRAAAGLVCCHQDIAADACFALGMLARFDDVHEEPWRYRDRHWECGMVGQALYLEAEAAGIRATGIGCFFDDEMHALLGLANRDWQSLYHFTAGGPVEDPRLTTLPPYGEFAFSGISARPPMR